MGQNNETTERGDRQGQQGGQHGGARNTGNQQQQQQPGPKNQAKDGSQKNQSQGSK